MDALALDALDLVVVVDNETDTLSSIDPGIPKLPELAGVLARVPPSRHHDGHLTWRGDDVVDDPLNDLASRVDPRVVAPGHCTGWRAKAALADRFAPGRYAPSGVGSAYLLQAEG